MERKFNPANSDQDRQRGHSIIQVRPRPPPVFQPQKNAKFPLHKLPEAMLREVISKMPTYSVDVLMDCRNAETLRFCHYGNHPDDLEVDSLSIRWFGHVQIYLGGDVHDVPLNIKDVERNLIVHNLICDLTLDNVTLVQNVLEVVTAVRKLSCTLRNCFSGLQAILDKYNPSCVSVICGDDVEMVSNVSSLLNIIDDFTCSGCAFTDESLMTVKKCSSLVLSGVANKITVAGLNKFLRMGIGATSKELWRFGQMKSLKYFRIGLLGPMEALLSQILRKIPATYHYKENFLGIVAVAKRGTLKMKFREEPQQFSEEKITVIYVKLYN